MRSTERALPCGIATPLPMPVVIMASRRMHAVEDLALAVEAVGGLEQVDQLDQHFALGPGLEPQRNGVRVQQLGKPHGRNSWGRKMCMQGIEIYGAYA